MDNTKIEPVQYQASLVLGNVSSSIALPFAEHGRQLHWQRSVSIRNGH